MVVYNDMLLAADDRTVRTWHNSGFRQRWPWTVLHSGGYAHICRADCSSSLALVPCQPWFTFSALCHKVNWFFICNTSSWTWQTWPSCHAIWHEYSRLWPQTLLGCCHDEMAATVGCLTQCLAEVSHRTCDVLLSCLQSHRPSLLERLTILPRVAGSGFDCFKRHLKTFRFCV